MRKKRKRITESWSRKWRRKAATLIRKRSSEFSVGVNLKKRLRISKSQRLKKKQFLGRCSVWKLSQTVLTLIIFFYKYGWNGEGGGGGCSEQNGVFERYKIEFFKFPSLWSEFFYCFGLFGPLAPVLHAWFCVDSDQRKVKIRRDTRDGSGDRLPRKLSPVRERLPEAEMTESGAEPSSSKLLRHFYALQGFMYSYHFFLYWKPEKQW